MVQDDDLIFMQRALVLAEHAASVGEVPVGAVLTKDNVIVAEGWNKPIAHQDPTAHAEIVTLRAAGLVESNYRLVGTTLYVTLEPCVMCLGAMVQARIERLVFGARDPKAGAVVSAFQLLDSNKFNHRIAWTEGVLAKESGKLLREFFAARR